MTQLIDVSTPKHPNTFTTVDDEDYVQIMAAGKWHAHRNTAGYLYVRRKFTTPQGRKFIYLHRFIQGVETTLFYVDHVNGETLDNRRCNLRVCTPGENSRNCRKHQRRVSSKYKGVSWFAKKKKWRAYIRVNGESLYLGIFTSELDAALSYDAACLKYHGRFAKTNQQLGLFDNIGLEIA